MRFPKAFCAPVAVLICTSSVIAQGSQEAEQGCTFTADPALFLRAQSRARESVQRRLERMSKAKFSQAAASAPIVRRNFIDDEIFGKLEQLKVRPAALSSDEEFIRRVTLDIIGRIPSAGDVRDFVGSGASDKRDALIEKLLLVPEFNDKWAVWFEDLVGMTEQPATNRRPRIEGRNSFDRWIREMMTNNRPMTEIVSMSLTGKGNNFFIENGPANFVILGSATMGPAQDTYDLQLMKSTTAFLGLSHYDCLLCHSGRGHLDQLSLWATRMTRGDAERMAAHFARTRLNSVVPGAQQYQNQLYDSTDVVDLQAGTYDLNTTFGNRPNRSPIGTERTLTPEYRDGTKASGNWRAALAEKVTTDPLFGVNFANRIWKEFFGMGLIDPVDAIDPDRLDPKNLPPAPWSLQPTHPELLQKLGRHFVENDTVLRNLIRTIVQSSAYQLSSRYDGEWKVDYVPLFARHYPRRLWAEEIHDAIVAATGVLPRYTWPKVNGNTVPQGSALPQSDPVSWAMQLPDVNEPRNVAAARDFMTAFLRGNRDSARRSDSGSILQQLFLMNENTTVLQRIKMANSPVLKELAKISDSGQLVEELWLTFLSRKPSDDELTRAIAHLATSTNNVTRNAAIEDLAWTAINKVDFLFSY